MTVRYRLAREAPAPAAIEDVRCVLSWIKANAAKYNFNPSRVVTYGESAGGHLALMGKMSPMTYIRTGLPPTYIVYGDVDRTVDPKLKCLDFLRQQGIIQ